MDTDLVVDVNILGTFPNVTKERLERIVRRALLLLEQRDVSVEVSVIDDATMRELNRAYRDKDQPTTVLSFPEPAGIPSPPDEPQPLGEIYLAPDTITRKKQDPYFLVMHGLLHLLGYTHENRSDTMEMEHLEDRLWETLSRD